jgi:acetyl-CoA synthetase
MTTVRPREIDPRVRSYEEAYRSFRWHVPARYNIARDVCDRHAEHPASADRVALIHEDYGAREPVRLTFRALRALSDRLALVLAARGVGPGDRVAVLMPQRPETALAHLAIYKRGAIAVPLTVLFRHDALQYRLEDSGARAIVTEASQLDLLAELRPSLPALDTVLTVDGLPPAARAGGAAEGWLDWDEALAAAHGTLRAVDTAADDPCVLIYTSGTTGNPKGALHAHRYLIGHLPGYELSHDFAPQAGDRFYTPADWAWIGGLTDALLPSWHYGLPVVSYRGKGAFDPERALRLMADHGVRNAFIPPTALKMMAQVSDLRGRFPLGLRTLMSGGEALSAATLDWAAEHLGVRINEIYGQTEMNYLVGNCAPLWPVRPGSMGRPYPGHTVAVVDEAGAPVGPGTMGQVAVRRGDDPVFFLGYWRNPQATAEKFIGDWALSGDLAEQDADGYLWFKGRADDVIISAGHRIGPTEIEAALLHHPAVALAAVVAAPDDLRGSIVKAFIRPAPGHLPSEELTRQIQDFVKERLARHEYPREIEYLDEFPLTTTGKIRRLELRQREAQRRAGRS